jgi:hypothetical protein
VPINRQVSGELNEDTTAEAAKGFMRNVAAEQEYCSVDLKTGLDSRGRFSIYN